MKGRVGVNALSEHVWYHHGYCFYMLDGQLRAEGKHLCDHVLVDNESL